MVPSTIIDITRRQRLWPREWLGGMNAAAGQMPFVLTWGYLAFGVAGVAAVQSGLMAAVLAVVLAPLVTMVVGRAPLPCAAPSAATALILGALVARLVADPALVPTDAAGVARLVACVALAVLVSGVLMVAMGLLRTGRLVRLVPQPVLAGFMNGVALLIMLSQVPALLGVPASVWAQGGMAALAAWQGVPLAVGLATVLLVVLIARGWPKAPAPLLALVLASAVVWVLEVAGLWPAGAAAAQRVSTPAFAWPAPDALAPWLDPASSALLARHAGAIVVTALLLALIGGLESVLSLAAVDALTETRSDPDRELVALGLANVAVGLLGGLFVVFQRLRAVSTHSAGGRTRHAVLASCLLLALAFSVGLPLVQQVPVAVVAGIVVMLGWSLVDRWTRQLLQQWRHGERSTDLRASLAVVAAVCAVTLAFGFVAGVGAGILISMAIFIHALNRALLRQRYSAAEIPSRRIYPGAVEAQLNALRERIEVFELEGAVFFGNVERLIMQAEAPAAKPLALSRAYLALDFRRVTTIDASGALAVAQLRERLRRQGTTLLLAGVTPSNRHGSVLRSHGVALEPAYADADHAIEAAELALLEQSGTAIIGRYVAPEHNALLRGLTEAQAAHVVALLRRRELAAGEHLFNEGDAGDALYLLEYGSISMVDAAREQRFVSFSPGMCFGETAVLDAGGRTSDALADVPSTVHSLPVLALRELEASDPAITSRLYRNVAVHLSQRLRSAAAAWRRAAG